VVREIFAMTLCQATAVISVRGSDISLNPGL
jgi:hypothetical protein